MKKIFNFPETILFGIGIFWMVERYLASGRIAYITMLITWLLFLQIIYKNRICGIIYGCALTVASCYKLYSIYDNGGEIFTIKSIEHGGLFLVALVMAITMVYKYVRSKENYGESVLTVTY